MTELNRDLTPDDIQVVVLSDLSVVACALVERAILVPAAVLKTREEAAAELALRNSRHPENLYALGPSLNNESFSLSAEGDRVRVTSFSRGLVTVWNGPYEENAMGIFSEINERVRR
ncbi:hypothetical protein HY025_02250 [Candidatus Daviesbacteria bacterium]|nr:hypothetical protein [Candidatus Daviesbacteria bacterium]